MIPKFYQNILINWDKSVFLLFRFKNQGSKQYFEFINNYNYINLIFFKNIIYNFKKIYYKTVKFVLKNQFLKSTLICIRDQYHVPINIKKKEPLNFDVKNLISESIYHRVNLVKQDRHIDTVHQIKISSRYYSKISPKNKDNYYQNVRRLSEVPESIDKSEIKEKYTNTSDIVSLLIKNSEEAIIYSPYHDPLSPYYTGNINSRQDQENSTVPQVTNAIIKDTVVSEECREDIRILAKNSAFRSSAKARIKSCRLQREGQLRNCCKQNIRFLQLSQMINFQKNHINSKMTPEEMINSPSIISWGSHSTSILNECKNCYVNCVIVATINNFTSSKKTMEQICWSIPNMSVCELQAKYWKILKSKESVCIPKSCLPYTISDELLHDLLKNIRTVSPDLLHSTFGFSEEIWSAENTSFNCDTLYSSTLWITFLWAIPIIIILSIIAIIRLPPIASRITLHKSLDSVQERSGAQINSHQYAIALLRDYAAKKNTILESWKLKRARLRNITYRCSSEYNTEKKISQEQELIRRQSAKPNRPLKVQDLLKKDINLTDNSTYNNLYLHLQSTKLKLISGISIFFQHIESLFLQTLSRFYLLELIFIRTSGTILCTYLYLKPKLQDLKKSYGKYDNPSKSEKYNNSNIGNLEKEGGPIKHGMR